MAHRASAAALHTARVILKHFDLTVKPPETLPSGRIPNLRADEACLAIIIDYATNVFHVASLRPELRYWQERLAAGNATAPQIAGFLNKVLEAFEMLPKHAADHIHTVTTLETPPEFGSKRLVPIYLSKPSLEAARFVFYYYDVTSKKPHTGGDVLDRNQVAKLAETSLGLIRSMEALPVLRHCSADLKSGKASVIDVRRHFRRVGVFLEYLPNYEDREEETKMLL